MTFDPAKDSNHPMDIYYSNIKFKHTAHVLRLKTNLST